MDENNDALRQLLGQLFPPDEQEESDPLYGVLQTMNNEAREARLLAEAQARKAANPLDTPNMRKWLQEMNEAAQEPDALDNLFSKWMESTGPIPAELA